MRRRFPIEFLILAALIVAWPFNSSFAQPKIPPELYENYLAISAKLLCSGVFISGRDPAEVLKNDLSVGVPPGFPSPDKIRIDVDRNRKSVTLSAEGIPARKAVYNGDQGCTLLPREGGDVFFKPVTLPRNEQLAREKWPMGDVIDSRIPPEVDEAAIKAALDFAFDESLQVKKQKTRSLLVVYRGQMIGERYAPGFHRDMPLMSWSMMKGITAALVGTMVRDGVLKVDDPAPISEWQSPNDPRRQITIRHLMNMTSGLKFMSGLDDPRITLTAKDQHSYVYFDAPNVYEYAIRNELESTPGTVWKYRNCDPLAIGKILRDKVEARGEEFLSFPARALFNRIGMRHTIPETDRWGNFILSGSDYVTARDWARFALLHMQDGVWQGERILPEGWIQFITQPAPANKAREYGAFFWLNAGKKYKSLPEDMYWPMGHFGQVAMIIPSRQLIVVRQGWSQMGGFDEYFEQVMQRILASVKTPSPK
jgi:CubicO group peptidase (beta-lactamase class C family)